MLFKKIWEYDQRLFHKLKGFQLHYRWQRIGVYSAIIVFMLMIAKEFFTEPSWFKPMLRNLLVISFLIISLSREKIEDEMMVQLRALSYRMAFVIGVIYYVLQPKVDYLVSNYIDPEGEPWEFSAFQLIIFMLLIQVMFFNVFKRKGL